MPKKAHTEEQIVAVLRQGEAARRWEIFEGSKVNAKRIYRLYTEEELIVRTKQRRKLARCQRGTMAIATVPNHCRSMDFSAP